jgi:hypothetical protein
MKYLFFPDARRGTHTRKADGVRGTLREYADTVTVEPVTRIVSADGFEPYMAPTPPAPPPPAPPPPAPAPLCQDADIVLQRLTLTERTALFTARRTSAEVDYFITRASSTGIISDADAGFSAAVAALATAGIIAAARWPVLLAP